MGVCLRIRIGLRLRHYVWLDRYPHGAEQVEIVIGYRSVLFFDLQIVERVTHLHG